MREIKFRAWHVELKKIFSAEEMGQDQLTLSVDGRGFVNVSGDSLTKSEFYGEEMIPMQFTGLKDKNGKEVYEGDVVEIDGSKVAVEWYNGAWTIQYFVTPKRSYLSVFDESDVEVVGNIYKNPELLTL